MKFSVDRSVLLAVVQAAARLAKSSINTYEINFGRVLLWSEHGLLRVSATDGTTHIEAWLQAQVEDARDPISTKAKEFAYLLKTNTKSGVLMVSSATDQEALVMQPPREPLKFPDGHELSWEPHPAVPSELLANIRIDALARALYVVDDFSAKSIDRQCYGANIEPLGESLRFTATNGHCLAVADIRNGVRYCAKTEEQHLVDYTTVVALLSLLSIWGDVAPDDVDCEVSLVRRTRVDQDGEVLDLDPVVVFDVSGVGHRAVVSTLVRREFAQYRNLLPAPDHHGIVLYAQAAELNQLAQAAIRAGPKGKPKVGFRFFYSPDDPSQGCMVRFGYAVEVQETEEQKKQRKRNLEDQPFSVQLHEVPSGYYACPVGKGLELMNDDDERIVSVDARYLATMTKPFNGKMLLKFHGVMDMFEAMQASASDDPDGIYCIGMPIRDGFDKEDI